jgi:peptidoglycan-N-acetylglucosamine deacetylase
MFLDSWQRHLQERPMSSETLRVRRKAARRLRRYRRCRRATVALVITIVLVVGVLVAGGGRSHKTASRAGLSKLGQAGPNAAPARRSGDRSSAAVIERLANRGRAVYCGAGRRRDVALTFDDGPGPYTRFAADELHRAGARVTWFLVGRNLAGRQHILAQERRVGELADHTWTHPLLPALRLAQIRAEMSRTQSAVAAAAAAPARLFRPPYGARDAQIDRQARALGMAEILWNVDSGDSTGADKHGIARNVIAGLHPGSIVLMHENRGQTIQALRRILPAIRRRHLKAVTVSTLLSQDPPSRTQLRAGPGGCKLYGGNRN